jgi:hypothetical protein
MAPEIPGEDVPVPPDAAPVPAPAAASTRLPITPIVDPSAFAPTKKTYANTVSGFIVN